MTSIKDIYEQRGHELPSPANVSGRLLEETVELAIANGLSPEKILMHVTDALANEARKAKIYPSELAPEFNKNEVCVELADVEIWVQFLMDISNIENLRDVAPKRNEKLESLEKSRLWFSNSHLLYRTP